MKILGRALAFWILLSGWSVAASGQIRIITLDPNALPQEIRFKGAVVAGARWLDKNGENLLLLCETWPVPVPQSWPAARTWA